MLQTNLTANRTEQAGAVRYFIIATTARSGSNYLCELLSANAIGVPGEDFNPYWRQAPISRFLATGSDFESCLKQQIAERTVGGFYGTKLLAGWIDHLRAFCSTYTFDWADFFVRFFPDARFIYLCRRDKARQAISLLRAQKSGQWAVRIGEQPVPPQPPEAVSPEQIHYLNWMLRLEEHQWTKFFATTGLKPYPVYYEDLLESPEHVLGEIVGYLGGELAEPLIVSNLLKQADEHTETYLRLYREDVGILSK